MRIAWLENVTLERDFSTSMEVVDIVVKTSIDSRSKEFSVVGGV